MSTVIGLLHVCKIFVNVCFVGYINLGSIIFLILMMNSGTQHPILKLSELTFIPCVNYLKDLRQNLLKLNICISLYKQFT